MYLQPRNQHR